MRQDAQHAWPTLGPFFQCQHSSSPNEQILNIYIVTFHKNQGRTNYLPHNREDVCFVILYGNLAAPMRLSWPQKRYLGRYLGEIDDEALAEALGVERKKVSDYRRGMGILPARKRDKDASYIPPTFNGQAPVPRVTHFLDRRDYLAALVSAIAILAVYIATLPPTVSGEDSGELITAAYTLGIPHPPGYPAWCILAHPFTYLPFGTVAWRVALSSAVFGAGAAFFVALTTIKLTSSRLGGCVAALLFAFSKDAWEQSIIAEVYALNALFIAACVFLLIEWYETRRNLPLLIFAFLYGLSLANHSTTRLLGPAFLLFVLVIDPVPWKRWKLYGACIGLSLVGLSAFLYLPIRSLANPPMDWGNPETFDNFLAVVRQEQFSFLLTQNKRSFGLFVEQMKMFFDYYVDAFTPFIAALPLLGLYPLWKSNRFLFAFVAGLTLLLSIGLVLALNYGTNRIAIVVNNVFFIPFAMMAAVFIGIGIAWIAALRIQNVSLKPATLLFAALCVLLPISMHYRANDKSNYWFAYDYGKNMLDTLEPNAIYLPAADHATFPIIYLQAVEGLRPDVTIGNKYGYPEEHLYADMPEEVRNSFHRIPTDSEQRMIEEWIVSRTDRPVYFTEKRGFPPQMGVKLVNTGLAYRIARGDEAWQSPDYWSQYTWHSLEPADTHGEFTAELVLSNYHFARGRDLLVKNELESAQEQFEQSATISNQASEELNNIGTALAENGHIEIAAKYYFRSIESDPNYKTGLRNLGQVYMSLEKNEAALLVLGRLKDIDPGDFPARYLYAACLKALGRIADAEAELLSIIEVRPNDARVHRELGLLYTYQLRNPSRGHQYLARSLELDPDQPEIQRLLSDPNAIVPDIPGLPNLDTLTDPLSRIPGLPRR